MPEHEKTESKNIKIHVVAGAVLERDGEFLLVQEAQAICRGKWNLPAGHVDANETLTEAVKREVYEESGFVVEPTGICQVGCHKNPNLISTATIFTVKIISGEIKYDPKEILNVRWFSYEEIVAMQDQLRNKNLILDAIKNTQNGIVAPLAILSVYSK